MIKRWRKHTVEGIEYNLLYLTLDGDKHSATNDIKVCLKLVEDNIFDRVNGKKNGRFYMLADTRKLERPSPIETISNVRDFMKRIRPYAKEYLSGSVLIIPNTILRNILGAVFKISPPTTDVKLVSTVEDANLIYNNVVID